MPAPAAGAQGTGAAGSAASVRPQADDSVAGADRGTEVDQAAGVDQAVLVRRTAAGLPRRQPGATLPKRRRAVAGAEQDAEPAVTPHIPVRPELIQQLLDELRRLD